MPSLPTQPFGRTGHFSSRIIFGGAALMANNPKVNARALDLLLEYGINHIDVAASYGDAEEAVGSWMPEHRKSFFIASKTGERTYEAAREQIRRSVERLGIDSLDLIQFHNLREAADREIAFSDDGALRAAVEARDEGLVRFIGVTGHGLDIPAAHLASLERFAFDSVLLPCNSLLLAREEYAAAFARVIATCRERGVAVQTIKAVARRRWPEGTQPTRRCWYEPIEDLNVLERAVHFVLAQPDVFLNTSSDLVMMERTLAASARFDGSEPDRALLASDLAGIGAASLFEVGLDDPQLPPEYRARPQA